MVQTSLRSYKHWQPIATSSSAVAKRPRDASCLSAVSFIPRAQFFLLLVTSPSDLPVRTIRLCIVVFGVTLSLYVIHTIHGRPWLCIAWDRAWSVSQCTQSRTTVTAYIAWRLVVRYPQSTKFRLLGTIRCSSYWSQSLIFVDYRDFSLLHLHLTPTLGVSLSEYCHDV